MWMNAARKTVRQSYVTDVCSLDAILSSCDHQVNLTESCNSTLDSATDLNMLMLPCNFVPLRQNLFPSRQRRNLLSLSRQLIIIVCRWTLNITQSWLWCPCIKPFTSSNTRRDGAKFANSASFTFIGLLFNINFALICVCISRTSQNQCGCKPCSCTGV